MRIGCSPAYLFAHFQEKVTAENLEWAIRRVAELGFSGLQLETYDSSQVCLYTEASIRRIRALFESLNLESSQFVAHSVKDGVNSLERQDQERGLAELECLVKICRQLGFIHTITIPSAPPRQMTVRSREIYPGALEAVLAVPEGWSWSRIWKEHLEVLRRCLEVVVGAGFRLAIEPVPYGLINHTDTLLRVAEELKSDRFGMNLDTGHIFVQRESLPITIEKLGPRLFGTHISDNDGIVQDHWKIGTGRISWPEVIAAFKKIGYQGALDIEINVVENADEVYRESKRYLEALL
jgi:sugar phosphate isomerase/epimerase